MSNKPKRKQIFRAHEFEKQTLQRTSKSLYSEIELEDD